MAITGEVVASPIPCCPHCDAEMPALGLFNWQAGPWMILSLYCPECKKVIHMQVLPMVAEEPSRLQIPS
jgi:hypothetical protein